MALTLSDLCAAAHLEAGACHVWRIGIDVRIAEGRSVLDGAEQARAARFHSARDGEHFTASHCAVRHILAAYLQRDPRELQFGSGAHGRPFLLYEESETERVDFNLSHSEGLALLAIVKGGSVGIDVERLRKVERAVALAHRYMTSNESAAVGAATEQERDQVFFRCWTRKEALLKCLGTGLTVDTRKVEVGAEGDTRRIQHPLRPAATLQVRTLSLGEAYIGACALDVSVNHIELRELILS